MSVTFRRTFPWAARLRWAAPLLAATLALATAGLSPPARAQPGETARASVVLTLTGLEPRAPRATDEIVLRGTVSNDGERPLRSSRVRLRASNEPVGSRSALAAEANSTAAIGSQVLAPGAGFDLPDIPPGGHAAFTVRAPVAALRLPGLGVYPLGVDLRGDDGDGIEALAQLRTFLPFGTAAARAQPTSIAWLWPLVDYPDRNPDGTFPDDSLAAAIRPGGRLGQILAAAGAVQRATVGQTTDIPLTLAVDPALLEALAAMAGGYQVKPARQPAIPGTGRAAAVAFLHQLAQLSAVNPVLALPYADPDLNALVAAGRIADVGIASGSPTFRQVVEHVLGTAPLERIAWPPGGYASQATLDALTAVDTVVLSGTVLPAAPAVHYTPDAATTLPAVGGGTLTALVSDPTLDALAGADPARLGGARLAEQRFLAETALITAEQPSVGRTVLIAPPHRWGPPASWATALLRDSARVPWLRPARLADLRPAAGRQTRGRLVFPASARRARLPASAFAGADGIRRLGTDLATFREILASPDSVGIPALDRALLRCESSAWQTDPAAGRALRAATRQALSAQMAKVRITTTGTVSLASKRSSIPISVANGLTQPVRIKVTLNSTAARLIAEDTGVKTVAGGHQIQLSVGLQAPGSGVFPVTAALLTPAGQSYGSPVRLRVYSSRYGVLALAITAAAVALLVGIAAVRLGRRLQNARRAEPGK